MYLIYRPLLKLAFVGNQAMLETARRVGDQTYTHAEIENDDALRFLAGTGFLLPDPTPQSFHPSASSAVLLLTNRCQLRCTYCYAAAGSLTPKVLSVESGKAAIDHVYEQVLLHDPGRFRVEFHGGGEPTLEWDTLQELVAYTRQKPIPAHISITTNAIWSEEKCDWIIRHVDGVSISMDGSAATQDRQRPFANQKPSSGVVFRNLKAMDDAGYAYGIRMTVCSPWDQLKDDVQFIFENTKCRSIAVEPAFNIRRGEHSLPDDDQYLNFAGAFKDAYQVARQYQAHLTYSGARPGALTQVFCAAPYNALVVNPDDQVVACYEITNDQHPLAELSTFGRIENGKVVETAGKREKFHGLLRERFESCADCFCQWTCAGDCFTRAFNHEDNYLDKGTRCEMNRELTRYLLLGLIADHEGVWNGNAARQAEEEKYG